MNRHTRGFLARLFVTVSLVALLPSEAKLRQMSEDPVWSLAATGDSIVTRRIAVYDDPAFRRLLDVIRGADVGFTNLECQLLRLSSFAGYPQAEHGGGYELGPPEAAEDLKWAGFDLVSRANNHTADYGIEGMLETSRSVEKAGLVQAGVGMTAGEAAQAAYLDTGKGRFALISFATTFSPAGRAGEARQEIRGRPGLNALRVQRTYQLSPQDMAAFRGVAAALGVQVPSSNTATLRLGRQLFAPGPDSRTIERLNSLDEDRILRSVRSAARQADYVVVTSHSHESGRTPEEPPPFLVDFARRCLDAGAQMFIVHGPHRVRGIEVYRGKPIFYSLADFIFQYETTEPQGADIYEDFGVEDRLALAGDLYEREHQRDAYGPDPANSHWWESIVAVPVFRKHELVELRLYPIELGHRARALTGDGRSQRGTPRLATEPLAREVITAVARLSAPFGTRILYRDGIGHWEPAPAASQSR